MNLLFSLQCFDTVSWATGRACKARQTSATRLAVRVTMHGTIRYVRYGFLLVCYSKFVPKLRRFSDI